MKIYDITAELCSYIISSCNEDFFVRYSCISHEEKKRISIIIENSVPEFFDDSGSVRFSENFHVHHFQENEFTDEWYEKLNSLIIKLKNDKDFFAIVGLVQVIDESLEKVLQKEIKKFEEDNFSVVMNSNREQCGLGLLPRCSCCWERKRRLSHYYDRMDNFLFNLLLLENSILGELIDKHIFLKPDFFPSFAEKQSLKIAMSPLKRTHDVSLDFYVQNKVQYFGIKYKSIDNQKDNNRIWDKILTAGKNNSDIIIFPEILGNSDTVTFVQEQIKQIKDKSVLPSMIVLPSYWNNNQNTVTVLDRNGTILCRQTKQNPFKIPYDGSDWLEHIKQNNVVSILHYEGIGRIAIMICKDFLTTKYVEQLMRCFKLTLLIVPSFSTGSYDFKQTFDLCAHDDCNVAWINTCAAMQKGKEQNFDNIGHVRKRISRLDDESQKLSQMKICSDAFNGKCEGNCIYYETVGAV